MAMPFTRRASTSCRFSSPMRRRAPRPYRPRAVRTELPTDGWIRFTGVARREGKPEKGGLRVTVPQSAVRGLSHTGWRGQWLRVRIVAATNSESPLTALGTFNVRVRYPRPVQCVMSLPLSRRGGVEAGDSIELEVMALR